jgi:hypothetical protein
LHRRPVELVRWSRVVEAWLDGGESAGPGRSALVVEEAFEGKAHAGSEGRHVYVLHNPWERALEVVRGCEN